MVRIDLGPTDDRGQLILIGAIAIALIVIGVVLVVNTALFTEVVGSEGTVETAKESGVAGEELEGSVSALVHETNGQEDTVSDVETAVNARLTNDLEPRLVNGSLDGRGAFVGVGSVTSTEDGHHLEQTSNAAFTNAIGASSWQPVPSTAPGGVGAFELIIDVPASTGTFRVHADDSLGISNRTLDVAVDTTNDEVDLRIDGNLVCQDIAATNDTVRIDATRGRVYEDPTCDFDLFYPRNEEYTVTFEDGDEVEGQYSLVTSGGPLGADTNIASDEPTKTEAIWAYEFEYTYDTDEVTATSERREVNVYD